MARYISRILFVVLISIIGIYMSGCASGPTEGSASSESAGSLGDDLNMDEPAQTGAPEQPLVEEELSDKAITGMDLGEDTKVAEPGFETPAPPSAAETAPIPIEPAAPAPIAAEPPSGKAVSIVDLKYIARKSGGTVEIDMSGPATYQTREVPSTNQFIVEIANARLPQSLKRPYVTKDFKQNIASINAYQDRGSSTTRVVIQMNRPATPVVMMDGNTLRISAEPMGEEANSALAANPTDAVASGGGSSVAANSSADTPDPDEGPKGKTALEVLPDTSVETPGTYSGKRISLEVADAPVTDVIRLISELSGANIIVDAGVQGTVNMKLRQVPWDQALLLILQNFQLGYVKQGNILRIGPLDRIRNEMALAQEIRNSQRQLENPKVKMIPLSYAKAADLIPLLRETLVMGSSGRQAAQSMQVGQDERTNSLIVRGLKEDIDRTSSLVQALDEAPKQVLIEAKVVEAKDSIIRKIGINWNLSGISVPVGTSSSGAQMNISSPYAANPGPPIATLSNAIFDSLGTLTATLQLLETRNEIKVVSSPRVVTVNAKQATIQQSNALAVPSTQTSANGQTLTTYNFINIPMTLVVTPRISYNQDITMEVNVRRSIAGTAVGNAPPPISERSAQTTVMVRNGQTAVIGGIYQSDTTKGVDTIPWVSDIPVLGWLFKSTESVLEKNELILFITPRIVASGKPVGSHAGM